MLLELSHQDRAAVITLSRPPVNAIDDELIGRFHETLDVLSKRNDWSVLHIRSSQKVFAAGADLVLIRSWKDAPSPSVALRGYIERLQGLYARIEALPQASVCEIGGAAMGGGYELALACDLRVAAEEAKIALPEVGIGLLPGAGGTQRLTRLCGRGVAARVILTGQPVDGATARQLGMVDWAFPRAELAAQAQKIVAQLAAAPAHSQQAAKRCIAAAGDHTQDGFEVEQVLGSTLLDSPDTQALIAAFLERNK